MRCAHKIEWSTYGKKPIRSIAGFAAKHSILGQRLHVCDNCAHGGSRDDSRCSMASLCGVALFFFCRMGVCEANFSQATDRDGRDGRIKLWGGGPVGLALCCYRTHRHHNGCRPDPRKESAKAADFVVRFYLV